MRQGSKRKAQSQDLREIWTESATEAAAELSTRECEMLKGSLKASYNELIKKGSGKKAIPVKLTAAIAKEDDKEKCAKAVKLLEEYKRGELALIAGRGSIEGLEENKLILTQAREKFDVMNATFMAIEKQLVDVLDGLKYRETMKAEEKRKLDLHNRYENNKVVNTKAENM